MNLTPEKEKSILEALKTKIESVEGAANVTTSEPLIDSKQDYLEALTVQSVDQQVETKYVKINYLGWRDSATDGCDDMPVVFVRYKIRAFQSYKEVRSDNSTSAYDVKFFDLNLRNEFLRTEDNARQILTNCETQPLAQQRDIFLGVDELTGAYGHIIDYTLEVEVL